MHGAGSQPEDNTAEPPEKESPEKTPEDPNEDRSIQKTAAPAPSSGTPTLTTPLTEELVKLKAEQALLKEVVSSFTISHIAPIETGASQTHGPSEEPEESHTEQSDHREDDGYQKQKDLEMESVD